MPSSRLLVPAIAICAALALSGCVGTTARTPSAHTTPAPTSSPSPSDSSPKADPAKPGVAYADGSDGAPRIERKNELPKSQRAKAPKASFTSPAVYSDGVTLSASKFERGTVTSKGVGILTGASYVVFTLTVANRGKKPLDLAAVVPTLRYGKNANTAAPLYDDVDVHDFAGTVAPGHTEAARYAFLIPTTTTEAVLYVDTDGTHTAAQFEGAIPG